MLPETPLTVCANRAAVSVSSFSSASLILAGVRVVQAAADRPMLLLLDDPAAELDRGSLLRLMRAVEALDCQVIATALDPEATLFETPPRLFHVEQGVLTNA